ncbi:cell envelope biogenesis protein OmpA [Methylophaga sp. 41_12_T18]|nr:cell envelope biogenesis protein OmpA [Methylophaga sp. 41_12_T18]
MIKLLTLLLTLMVPVAHGQQFQAPITDTHWQVIESPLECSLSQDIPGFGYAKFSQQTAEPFSLTFNSKTHSSVQTNITFEIAEAHWQNVEQRLHLISIPAQNNQTTFAIQGQTAKQAFTHIQQGRVPAIRYRSQNASEQIDVLFSTIHLADSLAAFEQCVDNLHPYTFDDISKLTITFAREKSDLTFSAKAALERIADYVKIDDKVHRIVVSGHTDNHGYRRVNRPLSEARALIVKNYLVEQGGLAENLVTTSSFMEHRPIATNKTLAGRVNNRRAEIEVIRR